MNKSTILLSLLILVGAAASKTNADTTTESSAKVDCVILLHGLGRSGLSMKAVEWRLEKTGYHVVNQSYPSTKHSIEDLAQLALGEALPKCESDTKIHFVTHSLGGILLRQYLSEHSISNMGRTVMLGPPNQGSMLADYIQTVRLANDLQPEAGRQLGTKGDSVPQKLGPVDFELGIIAGNRNWRPMVSLPLDGPSDGTVTVEETKIDGMTDFLELPATHTTMMWQAAVLDEIIAFLESGHFSASDADKTK